MSDFIYNVTTDSTPDDGEAWFQSSGNLIRVSTVSNTGLDLADFLDVWIDEVFNLPPCDIKFTYTPVSGDPISGVVEVDEIKTYSTYVIELGFSSSFLTQFPTVDTTSGTISLELGLKPVQKDKPCGGYEEFDIDDDNPTCTNGCVFRNVTSGKEFRFSNLEQGQFAIYFEGPNERYQIIWDTPSGNCDPDKIGIQNRVVGKTLYLEDYGNSPNSGDINFGDLIITITHGSFEWAGGDTDTVFYTTVNNGTLCGPGFICENGQCVEDTSPERIDHDDLLLIGNPKTKETYHVRAGDYMIRADRSYAIPVTRGSQTYYTSPFSFGDILDTDSIAIYRPSDSTVYKITGKQYIYEFQYRSVEPEILGVRLYKKFPELATFKDQVFVLEIDTNDTSGKTVFDVAPRILTLTDVTQQSQTYNLKIRNDLRMQKYLETDRSGSELAYIFGDVYAVPGSSAGTNDYWVQASTGAQLEFIFRSGDNQTPDRWTSGNWYVKEVKITGAADLDESWSKVYPDRPTRFHTALGDIVAGASSFTFTVAGNEPENLPIFASGNHSTNEYTNIQGKGGSFNDAFDASSVNFRTLQATCLYRGDPNGDGPNQDRFESCKDTAEKAEERNGTAYYNLTRLVDKGKAHRHLKIADGVVDSIDDIMDIQSIGTSTYFEFRFTEDPVIFGVDVDTFSTGGSWLTVSVGAKNPKGEDYWVNSNYLLAN